MENPYIKMIKALIVDDDLEYSKNMVNSVVSKFTNVQVSYLASTYQEGMDIITNNKIDLIFLDLKLPDYNGTKIIEDLKYLNSIQKPKIIIVSGDTQLISQTIITNNVCEIISKPESQEVIYKKIERIINNINYENNYNNIEKLILTEILTLGYKLKYKGTQYIKEAINYIYESNNFNLIDNLEQNVYKFISYKHKKSINNIKTNIIKATNTREKDKMLLYELTPKQTIITILNKIYQEFN